MGIGHVRNTGPCLSALRSPWEEPVRLVAAADAVAAVCHQLIGLGVS